MMIFALAVIGCAVFTTYAAGLFFRQKSRETGVFLALGASRTQLKTELRKDLAVISTGSCAAGAVLGGPLAWAIWTLFRLFLVDSQEMPLSFDPGSYLLALAFAVYVTGMLFLLGGGPSVRPISSISSRNPTGPNPSGRSRAGMAGSASYCWLWAALPVT